MIFISSVLWFWYIFILKLSLSFDFKDATNFDLTLMKDPVPPTAVVNQSKENILMNYVL